MQFVGSLAHFTHVPQTVQMATVVGVALGGLARGGDLGVNQPRERVEDAVLQLDVELPGHVLAAVVEDFDLGGIDGQILVIEVVRNACAPYLVGLFVLVEVHRDAVDAGFSHEEGASVDADGRVLDGEVVLLRGEVGRKVEHRHEAFGNRGLTFKGSGG